MEGVYHEVFPVFWVGVAAWAAAVFLSYVDVFVGEPPGDSGEEWYLLPEELDASILQVGWHVRWA